MINVNYQVIMEFITQFMYIVGPIAIIFVIIARITNFFIEFVRGDRRIKL